MIKNLIEPLCSIHNQPLTMVNLERRIGKNKNRFMCDACTENEFSKKVILFSKALGIKKEINDWQSQILFQIQNIKKIVESMKAEILIQLNELDKIIEEWIKQIKVYQNQNDQLNQLFDEIQDSNYHLNKSSVTKIQNVLFKLEVEYLQFFSHLQNPIFSQQFRFHKQQSDQQTHVKQKCENPFIESKEMSKNDLELIEMIFIQKFEWGNNTIFNKLLLEIENFQVYKGVKIVELTTQNSILRITQLTPEQLQLGYDITCDKIIFDIDQSQLEYQLNLVKQFKNLYPENSKKQTICFLTYEQGFSKDRINNSLIENYDVLIDITKYYHLNIIEIVDIILKKMVNNVQQKSKSSEFDKQFQFDNIKNKQVNKLWSENKEINSFYQNCLNLNVKVIKIDSIKYDILIQFLNYIFYCCTTNQFQKITQETFKAFGKLYLIEFDTNMNPNYLIQEGCFEIDIKQARFKLNGIGIEYCQKSNKIKYEGNFEEGCLRNNTINNNQAKSQSNNQSISKVIKDQYQVPSWCRFNQQINLNDLYILTSNLWLSSNIIDAFVLYLNLNSEQQYFSLTEVQRKDIQRILFMPTSLTTNFVKPYDFNQAKKIFEEELLQYQEINYDLKKVYSKIGFPINKNNSHWYFLLYDLQSNNIIYTDSLNVKWNDIEIITLLKNLLTSTTEKNISSKQFSQQKDGYSCGYHVCSVMSYYQESQFNQTLLYCYDEAKIKDTLYQVIKQT
ncbi:unnamed protein product [Paramecium sonneborni]|uniref:Ubiquitin-like protease family profile domain-containing protein n=1 Tax=Paramecium sonneborni TaxID=65129 RepID=A0A8S1Q8Z3_9CILI|nr:unnamed protein product [Paramecium sonneborni]